MDEKLHLLSNEIDEISLNNRVQNVETNVKGVNCHWTEVCGLTTEEVFNIALKFYKENEGKALTLSYQDKLKLVAYRQQVRLGPFKESAVSPLGVLDVIGRNRRDAWQSLQDLDRKSAMIGFIKLLDEASRAFKPYVKAQKAAIDQQKQQAQLDARLEAEQQQRFKKEEEERQTAELRRRRIQDALNAQTFEQFRSYAEEQYPDNPEQQAVLVRQLQEQHYQQYMQQLIHQQNQSVQTIESAIASENCVTYKGEQNDRNDGEAFNGDDKDDEFPSIRQPSMWTQKNIKEFKESIKKEGSDGIITLAQGETITIRVPTHEDGSCLYWEFATDSYDVGFGVFFEWSKSSTNQISVHVDTEDEDDDANEDFLDDDDDSDGGGDVERGHARSPLTVEGPPVSVIVPNLRRDCHLEVYAGSHAYPGIGVYLLKFDNSYSVWRSKTLYYRVYYTR